MDKCMIHVHERGHSGGDLALNLAARYAERIVEDLKIALEERIDGESAECEAARQALKILIDKNISDISGLTETTGKNSADIDALEQAGAKNSEDITDLDERVEKNSADIVSLSQKHNSDISAVTSSVSTNKSDITAVQGSVQDLTLNQSNLSRRMSELELSGMHIQNDIPEAHAEDLLVDETGIYIDSAGKTHDCGVVAPGVLFVFADDNAGDIYRFYISQGNGIYVCNGNEWIFLNEKIKYISKPVKIGEWFDGVKSVYRYVFGYSLSSNDQSVVTGASPYTILHEVTNDQNEVFVNDCKAFLRMGGETIYEGCCIDDVPVPYIKYGFDTSGLTSDYASRFDSFTGYIDFVTKATNIKS